MRFHTARLCSTPCPSLLLVLGLRKVVHQCGCWFFLQEKSSSKGASASKGKEGAAKAKGSSKKRQSSKSESGDDAPVAPAKEKTAEDDTPASPAPLTLTGKRRNLGLASALASYKQVMLDAAPITPGSRRPNSHVSQGVVWQTLSS